MAAELKPACWRHASFTLLTLLLLLCQPGWAQTAPEAAAKPVSEASAAQTVPFEVLLSFEQSGLNAAEQRLLRDAKDLRAFWQRHAAGQALPAELARTDFTRHWLLALADELQPTPGYRYCLHSLQQSPLLARLQRQLPSAEMFFPRQPSRPGCFVRLPVLDRPQLSFETLPPPPTERIALPMRTLSQVSNSLINQPRRVIVRDLESFRLLWREHTGSFERLPDVDFTQDMVIAIFMGEQPTGGFGAEIAGLSEDNQTLRIRVRESAPDPDRMVIQMLTAPAHLVAVPARDLQIHFETTQEVQ